MEDHEAKGYLPLLSLVFLLSVVQVEAFALITGGGGLEPIPTTAKNLGDLYLFLFHVLCNY
jgi:hypothetical protein